MAGKKQRDRGSHSKMVRAAIGKVKLGRPVEAWTVEITVAGPSSGRWNAVQVFPDGKSAERAWEASRRTCRQHAAIAARAVVVP
ncbi:MAG: hypothetical protein ACYDAL_16370 [Candidatus Dormibacteraceae bacterium]